MKGPMLLMTQARTHKRYEILAEGFFVPASIIPLWVSGRIGEMVNTYMYILSVDHNDGVCAMDSNARSTGDGQHLAGSRCTESQRD
jgi:hypothetical protein